MIVKESAFLASITLIDQKNGVNPVAKSTQPKAADHLHRGGRVYAYEFKDAETLLADFDKGVNAALKRKGVKI
jgi:hypothetical protein